jgi:hypothetical protein
MCYLSKLSTTSHFVPLFLGHGDVVVVIAIFHIKLSTPQLGSFICSSLILQGSWSDHCNLILKKKEKKALLHGLWKLEGTRWNRLAIVWERKKGGEECQSFVKEHQCAKFSKNSEPSHLFIMEDSKSPLPVVDIKQPPLKINLYFCFTNEKL